jgi:hypothetical protein
VQVADYVCELFSSSNGDLIRTLDADANVASLATGELLVASAELIAHFSKGERYNVLY